MNKNAIEAYQSIRKVTTDSPTIGVVLGSGLGDLVNELEEPMFIRYESIPHFPVSTVSGHKGQLVFGQFQSIPVVMLQGRFHYYEGYSIHDVVFPIQLLKLLGVKQLLLTNAAGGIHRSFSPGDLMIITDHLNLIKNITIDHQNETSIFAQSIYSKNLITKAEVIAKRIRLNIHKGVYAAVSGPSYETPAEIRMLEKLGADAVGMSTAPEAQFAYKESIEVFGVSCISNLAAGIENVQLRHEDVIETTEKVNQHFKTFMKELLKEMTKKGELNE